eukprot:Gb_23126 [translate_table: standard]
MGYESCINPSYLLSHRSLMIEPYMGYSLTARKLIHPLPRKSSNSSSFMPSSNTVAVQSVPALIPNWISQPNSYINTLCRESRLKETLNVLHAINHRSMPVDSNTYASLLEACTNMKTSTEGRQVQARILVNGLEENEFLAAKLVNMYAICGNIVDARLVFDKIYKPNVFVWNIMIRGYAWNGPCEEAIALYSQMQQEGIHPNNFTFPFLLKACAGLSAIEDGMEIHYDIIRSGFESDVFVGSALIDMYAKCGRVDDAQKVFDKMPVRDVVSWNAVIAGYAQNGHANKALTLFNQMQLADVKPSSVTMASVLPACAHLTALQQGKCIHDIVTRSGFESDVSVGTALIDMYAKCGSIAIARKLFDRMSKRNAISWTAMIAGYAQNGCAHEGLVLFHRMQLAEVIPNTGTMVSVIRACAHLAILQQGKWIHAYAIRSGFDSDVSVGNSLVAMYAKCASVEIARQFFDKMSKRDVISWNAMIAGYTQNGHANEGLTLFQQMQLESVKPDLTTMVSVLPACAHLAALQQGKLNHAYILRKGFESDISVMNALIDVYAKCGNIDLARHLFDKMTTRDVISWNVMIAGYGIHGHSEDALALFTQLQQTGAKPDHITFICVLSACSHAGLVHEGWKYFACMNQDYFIKPMVEHYVCMVDLLGRAGNLNEALELIERMPFEPVAGVWGALLGACRIHCNVELGEHVAQCLLDLEPNDTGNYILLSNIYASAGRWDGVAKVRSMLKDRGLKKSPGCSWIEIKNRVHAFLGGDRSHPQSEEIYAMLERLIGQMKKAGYVPDTSFVLHDVEEEEKEYILCTHSEKLAIAFGIIETSPGTSIQITKNLRVCGDCHTAIKFISKIVRREILLRDLNRFHRFKDGLCSCGDYW